MPGAALALRSASRLVRPSRTYSGTALQTPAGSVSAFFNFEAFDRRSGIATYAVRVVNRTKSILLCRIWVISSSEEPVLASPLPMEVPALSTSSTRVPVWPRDFSSFDRAVLEVVGEGVHCIAEAVAPVTAKPQRGYVLAAAACLVIGSLAFGIAGALGGALPRISAFAVPPETLVGTTVEAEYHASGAGRLTYSVTAPDGRRLQGGTLADRSGVIPVAIPASNATGAYTLQLALDGPLGTATQTRVLNTVVPQMRGGAQISDIAVRPVLAKPGQVIDVAYAAAADGGYVRLLGTDGTVWEQKPFSRNGDTEFVIPSTPNLREMRVLLHVTKGRSAAQSMAGLVVANAPSAVTANEPSQTAGGQVAGDDNPNAVAPAGTDENGTFEVLNRTVKSGAPIQVRIISPRNGMQLALDDMQSHQITAIQVGDDADVVTLKAPTVTVATRYTVVATFVDGFGQESIVQPVTVEP